MTEKCIYSGAHISACDKYRYKLWREWRGTHDSKNWLWYGEKDGQGEKLGEPLTALFVMLNPSTADAEKDDATIRKCIGFAKLWNYERMGVINLFAYRTKSPRDLFMARSAGIDIIGWENQKCIQEMIENAGLVVCAWGGNGEGNEYHIEEVRGWLDDKKIFHLGLTRSGHPRHPLYVPYTQKLLPMER